MDETLRGRILRVPAFFALLLLTACASPRAVNTSTIRVGPGPEDIVIDRHAGPVPRLIVSCGDHRDKKYGEIWQVDLGNSRHSSVMRRTGEPPGLAFRPHGIDLAQIGGQWKLYVINHEDAAHTHSVLVYVVESDNLRFEKLYRDEEYLPSPNDVAALPDASFYVTNDYGSGATEAKRWISGEKVSRIAYCTAEGQWKLAADGLQFANGIAIARDGSVLVAETRAHKLLAYDRAPGGELVGRRTVTVGLWGADNLTINDRGEVLVPGHVRPLSLAIHRKVPALLSPVSVWRVTVGPPARKEVIFEDDGSRISGATVAVEYGERLYLGQAFDAFIFVTRAR